MPDATDSLGRPGIAEAMREMIAREFAHVPADKRGVLLVVADARGVRAHLAARINGHWKVAAGAGWVWQEPRPAGYVAVEASW